MLSHTNGMSTNVQLLLLWKFCTIQANYIDFGRKYLKNNGKISIFGLFSHVFCTDFTENM